MVNIKFLKTEETLASPKMEKIFKQKLEKISYRYNKMFNLKITLKKNHKKQLEIII